MHTDLGIDPFLVINAGHICCWAAGDALLVTRSPCTRCTGNGVGVRGVPALVEISTGSLPAPSLAVRDARMLFGLLSLPASCLNDARRARAALGHAWACAASPRWPAARRAPTPAAALRRPSSPRCGRDAPTVVVHYFMLVVVVARKKGERDTAKEKVCCCTFFWLVSRQPSLSTLRSPRPNPHGRPPSPPPPPVPACSALPALCNGAGRVGFAHVHLPRSPHLHLHATNPVARSNV